MPSYTSAITALAVMLHALFGCCWHHAHAAEPHGGSWQSVVSAQCDHHHAHALNVREPSASPVETPDHSRDCEGDRCTFVRADDGARGVISLEFSGLPPIAKASPTLHRWQALTAEAPSPSSPTRLHLMHCVLLI